MKMVRNHYECPSLSRLILCSPLATNDEWVCLLCRMRPALHKVAQNLYAEFHCRRRPLRVDGTFIIILGY